MKFSIVSIIASLCFDAEIDLIKIEELLKVVNYSGQPHFLAFRLPDLRVTTLVYKSGTIVFAGAKSFIELDKAKETILSKLSSIGIELPPVPLEIGNVVAISDVGEQLDLEAIFKKAGFKQIEYNPEIFPSLIYRKPQSTLVLLIFHSGKIVITGAKSTSHIEEGLKEIQELIFSNYMTQEANEALS